MVVALEAGGEGVVRFVLGLFGAAFALSVGSFGLCFGVAVGGAVVGCDVASFLLASIVLLVLIIA